MNTNREFSTLSDVRIATGYALSVTSAVTFFVASSFPRIILQRASSGLLYPLWATALVLLSDCLFIVFLWLPAALISALPCALLNLLASRLRIQSPLFYLPAGGVVGLLTVVPFVSVTSGWSWYTDPPDAMPPTGFWQAAYSCAPLFVAAGAIAGLTFWIAAGRTSLYQTKQPFRD